MRWRIFNTIEAAGAFCAAIDVELGYPIEHDERDLVRHGAPPPGGWPAVTTETKTGIVKLDDGRFAVAVDDETAAVIARTPSITGGPGVPNLPRPTEDRARTIAGQGLGPRIPPRNGLPGRPPQAQGQGLAKGRSQ